MMAGKARLFGDTEILAKIMETSSPKTQQELGRQVKGFKRDIWDAHARPIVFTGNVAKFLQNPEHCKALMASEGTTLVEASPYDTIWGIGWVENDPQAQDRSLWRGLNWLGETLTKVRVEISRL